jgi:hypothetical protein
MRNKLFSIFAGLALVALSASSALAGTGGGGADLGLHAARVSSGTVTNGRGSNTTAQVVWGTDDPATGAGHYGGIYGGIEDSGTIVGLWEQDFHAVTCDDGTTGSVGTSRIGDGSGTVTIAPNLQSAVVTGVLTIYTSVFDTCAGTEEVVATETGVPMRLDLAATGQPSNDVSSFHDLLAGVYNFHQSTHIISRQASGSALLDGKTYAFDAGLISGLRSNYHENSR